MGRPPGIVNHEVLGEAQPVIELFESLLDAYRSEAELLAKKYLDAREAEMMERNQTRCYGLFLSFEEKQCPRTGQRYGYLYWRMGRSHHNSPAARAKRKGASPITRNVHACGPDGSYTRKNIRSAMPFAKPWEVRLTYSFEQEAHKIRKFLNALNQCKRSLIYFPIPPVVGPN